LFPPAFGGREHIIFLLTRQLKEGGREHIIILIHYIFFTTIVHLLQSSGCSGSLPSSSKKLQHLTHFLPALFDAKIEDES
jgi:hypothetical protein